MLRLGGDGECDFDAAHQLVHVLKPLAHRLLDVRIESDAFFAGLGVGGHNVFPLGVRFIYKVLVHRDLRVPDVIAQSDRHSLSCFVVVAFVADSG